MYPNRKCGTCKVEKPATEEYFSPRPNSRYKHGLNSVCKSCAAIKQQDYRDSLDPERLKEMKRGWARDTHLRKTYGLDRITYAEEVEQRNGECDLCNKVPSSNLVPDHDHQTGKLRGFLCYACNNGIGQLGDTYEAVYNALGYLLDSEIRN